MFSARSAPIPVAAATTATAASSSPSSASSASPPVSAAADSAADATASSNPSQPPKHIACTTCKKRKLKCDGARPKCGTCQRGAKDCEYSTERKKSGPKKGYVKILEDRVAELEKDKNLWSLQLIEHSYSADPNVVLNVSNARVIDLDGVMPSMAMNNLGSLPRAPILLNRPDRPAAPASHLPPPDDAPTLPHNQVGHSAKIASPSDESRRWEMVDQNIEEPLPAQELIRLL